MAVRRRSVAHTILGGVWLGWKVDSNWADPWLFAGYAILRPLAQSLILVVMYWVIAHDTTTGYFGSLMVGGAFFTVVQYVLAGTSWCVIEDREFYSTIRYIYLASRSLVWYLLGRAVAKLALALLSVGVILVFVKLALGAPVWVHGLQTPAGLAALAAGVGATAAMGIGLSGVLLLAARRGEFYSEAVAGSIFLAAGAVFPPDVLPRWLQGVAAVLPQTYWLEATRRWLVEGSWQWSAWLSRLPDGELFGRLLASGSGWGLAGVALFLAAEAYVRRTGTLDHHTED
ncbi:MAG: ABC transporter permease [Limnochordaceae bacterium]|nr:ABC transporter permease [Limnochordaceae bacterium]